MEQILAALEKMVWKKQLRVDSPLKTISLWEYTWEKGHRV